MYKAIVILAVAGVASAGLLGVADYHVGASSDNTYRSFGGLSSVSSRASTVQGAYSTSSQYKNKATNAGLVGAYAAPAYAPAYAAAAPVAYAAPVARAIAAPVAHAAYAPAAVGYSPALGVAGVAHSFFDGLGVHYAF